MATSDMVPTQTFHVRSVSLPSRSHPLVFKIEEELHKLKSSSQKVENDCIDLKSIGETYSYIDELLHLPSTQQAFSNSIEKKWLENELEGSVRLLDLCGAFKEMLVTIEENVRELRLALRKRGEYVSDESLRAQIFSKKETQNDIKKCQNLLKRVDRMCSSSCPSIDKAHDASTVATMLIEAREVTASLIRSAMSILSVTGQKTKVKRWSFVSKAISMKKVECVIGIIGFEDVVAGLDCLFRRLIQNRVSLLNILSL